VAYMEKRVFVGKHKGEDHLEDLGIDRRIILE
jgi:hypothetical protein